MKYFSFLSTASLWSHKQIITWLIHVRAFFPTFLWQLMHHVKTKNNRKRKNPEKRATCGRAPKRWFAPEVLSSNNLAHLIKIEKFLDPTVYFSYQSKVLYFFTKRIEMKRSLNKNEQFVKNVVLLRIQGTILASCLDKNSTTPSNENAGRRIAG